MSTINKYTPPKKVTDFCASIEELLGEIEFVTKSRAKVSNVPAVFDIEASSFYNDKNEKRCCMYAWVFGINGKCVRGRTWREFLDLTKTLQEFYSLSPTKRLIVYVHNLSYEFQWIKKLFEWEKVFSVDTRKPVYAITKTGIEFRCSYILTGYSLAKLGENLMKYKVKKMVGGLDYNLIRHSETPLTQKEWGYILNDGLVVMAHIQEEIERLGSIKHIPLTMTGYVRGLCKQKCLQGQNRWDYSRLIRSLTLDAESYSQLKRAYSGGFTHANANFVGQIIENVESYDFTSSYPAVMVSEMYPMSKPFYPTKLETEEDFVKYLKNFCCMFEITFSNLRSIAPFENYISYSKCIKAEHYVLNNGRIVEADLVKITLTEQDFFIIAKMYKWDSIEVSNMKCFYKGYLPKDFILSILELYKSKTELKGVKGKEVEYMVSKNMLNSCYGMCVTDICKDDVEYSSIGGWELRKADVDAVLNKYNSTTQRFLYYAWGVWVTAYARRNLFSGIFEFGDDYIYSDTDSIKVKNADRHREYIERYNQNIIRKVEKCLKHYGIDTSMASPKTVTGKVKPIGVWEYEGLYSRFKTLGAKRYITEEDGKLAITIAGVSKSAGLKYLKHTFGDNDTIFREFEENLYFPAHYDYNGVDENGSGKLCHTYIDCYIDGYVVDYLGNKCIYNEQSGVHMENTDYSLSLTSDFIKLILGYREGHIHL